MQMLLTLLVSLAAAAASGCELRPPGAVSDKAPGDNYYRLLVNGEVERYAPGERYVGEFRLSTRLLRTTKLHVLPARGH